MTVYPDADAASMNYVLLRDEPETSTEPAITEPASIEPAYDSAWQWKLWGAQSTIVSRLGLIDRCLESCLYQVDNTAESEAFRRGYIRAGLHQIQGDIDEIRKAAGVLLRR